MFTNLTHAEAKDDAYHRMEGYSFSQIKLLPSQPELFHGYHIAKPPKWTFETTEAMELGTVAHGAILEGKPFGCPPDEVLSKSGSRAGGAWKEYEASHTPFECLRSKDARSIAEIHHNCRADSRIRALLDCPGDVEYSLFGEHAATNIKVRGRIDKVCQFPSGRMILDLKTFSSDPANERVVGNAFIERSYFQQAAMYMDLMEAHGKPCDAFAFVFVRTAPPFNAVLWVIQEADLIIGRRRNEKALLDLRRRLDTNDWRGATFGQVNYLHLPKWFYDRADETTDYSSDFSDYALTESEL